MKYVTDDGKYFDKISDAKAHEDELIKAKEDENKREEERKKLYDEVNDAYTKYSKLMSEYNKKYGLYKTKNTEWINDLFDEFFSLS